MLVAAPPLNSAIKVLYPLGVLPTGRKAPGEVPCHMIATVLHLLQEGETAGDAVGEGGGAAAHVDQQAAALHLLGGEAGKRRGVAGGHPGADVAVAALESVGDVAQRMLGDADRVGEKVELLAGEAARVG